MRFSNAYEGIKRVFVAQIMSLISSGCILVAAIVALMSAMTMATAGGIGSLVLSVGSIVLSLLSLIWNLIGLHQAGKDEEKFKNAFILSVIILVLNIVSSIITLCVPVNGLLSSILEPVQIILTLWIIYYVIEGIRTLADKLGKPGISKTGKNIFTLICITLLVAIIAKLIVLIFSESMAALGIAGVLALLSGIAAIVAYILYLVYLNKAKNMLAEPAQENDVIESAPQETAKSEPADDVKQNEAEPSAEGEEVSEAVEEAKAETEEKPQSAEEPSQDASSEEVNEVPADVHEEVSEEPKASEAPAEEKKDAGKSQ